MNIAPRVVLSPASEASGGTAPPTRTIATPLDTSVLRRANSGDPLVKLPDYANAYKESIREDFEYLKSIGAVEDEKLRARVDASLNDPNGTTWGDLFFIERTILRLQSDDVVRRRAWTLRDRYRVVIGEQAYNEYLKSSPPSSDPDKPAEPLRHDLDRLLCDFHWRYQTTPMREGERNRVSGRIAFFMFLAFGLVLVAMGIDQTTSGETGLSTVLVVLLMGALGAFISLQHRIQSLPSSGDAILNILSLREGWVSLFLSPLSGALFAFVLFLAFSAGLLQGSLFPNVAGQGEGATPGSRLAQVSRLQVSVAEAEEVAAAARIEAGKAPVDGEAKAKAQAKARNLENRANRTNQELNAVESKGLSFLDFLRMAIPRTVADLAKLLLWCFIAGFAERLIPDTLDRLIVRKIAVMEAEPPSNAHTPQILAGPPSLPGGGQSGKAPASPGPARAGT